MNFQLPLSSRCALLHLAHAALPHLPPAAADRHFNFGAQSLSNIIYSAASMGQKADYDLLHAVARAVEWEVEQFRPQVRLGQRGWWGQRKALVGAVEGAALWAA